MYFTYCGVFFTDRWQNSSVTTSVLVTHTVQSNGRYVGELRQGGARQI